MWSWQDSYSIGHGKIREGHREGLKWKTSFITIYINFSGPLVRLDVRSTQDALLTLRRHEGREMREGANPLPHTGNDAS